jgi:hypothetical protein
MAVKTIIICPVCNLPKSTWVDNIRTGRYLPYHRECVRIHKTCSKCGATYIVPAYRKDSKYCSAHCRALDAYILARAAGFGARAGDIPHNKGKKSSDETRRKLSESHMGQVVWNKGTADLLKRRLSQTLKCAISRSLKTKKGGRHWETLVGWTLSDLMNHLAKQFKPGMSWDNYGEWHIDHIVPLSSFNMSSFESIDFSRCWSLKNLQPLWRTENLSKPKRPTAPFQPALDMGKWAVENYGG